MFEIPANGALLLTESIHNNGLELLFDINKELLIYENENDLIEKARHIIQNPHEYRDIRIAGQKRAKEEHTYEHRMSTLLNSVTETTT